jgi:hypothetical protein
MIVGIKTVAFKAFRWILVGGQRRRACWFDITKYELHPTKGWRRIWRAKKAVAEREWIKYPQRQVTWETTRRPAIRGVFADGSRLQPTRDMVQVRDPQGSTRHLQRHGWYRRAQRKLGVPPEKKHA